MISIVTVIIIVNSNRHNKSHTFIRFIDGSLQVYVADGVNQVEANWRSSADSSATPIAWSNSWTKSGSQTGITV